MCRHTCPRRSFSLHLTQNPPHHTFATRTRTPHLTLAHPTTPHHTTPHHTTPHHTTPHHTTPHHTTPRHATPRHTRSGWNAFMAYAANVRQPLVLHHAKLRFEVRLIQPHTISYNLVESSHSAPLHLTHPHPSSHTLSHNLIRQVLAHSKRVGHVVPTTERYPRAVGTSTVSSPGSCIFLVRCSK